MTSAPVLELLAAWAASRPIFSPTARRRAYEAFVDTVACMLAGAGDPATAATRGAYAYAISRDSGSLLVSGGSADAAVAACINGTSAHALDFDDSFAPAVTHASAILVPSLIAIAQAEGLSGRALVDAYLIGLEAQAIVGRGVNPAHYALGWHASSTIGCIGAAAATARLMGLEQDGIARAMSVAASMASGIKGQFGTLVKPLHVGLAARNAIEAARFGAAGMTGRTDILEAPHGFLQMFGGPDAPGYARSVDPGNPHSMDSDGLRPKRHPCCGATHNTLDALLDLKQAHGFGHQDVHAVVTVVSRTHAGNLPYTRPRNAMQARFSMHYCAALALAQDRLTLRDFTDPAVGRAWLEPLMARIDMRCHDAATERAAGGRPPHSIAVTLVDGTRLVAERSHPKGSIADPLEDQDREAKFTDCAAHLRPTDRRTLYEQLSRLDQMPDLSFLAPAFQQRPQPF